ncbi:MAG: class II fructose-bisphosphate aldolase [Peptococcaceae bacterium]|jgi:fructose-bisphosphate aldolase class II|nr:class II fructose-bisphosphate aldolase [Peptococcaceae bacterium]
MLVSAKEVWQDAKAHGYAVCAPNILNAETAQKCIEAAEELKAPIILDAGYRGPGRSLAETRHLYNLVRAIEPYAHAARVPVVIQQDHGKSYESAVSCIAAGFTSIMVDRSQLPFDDNVAQVAELVKIAHAAGISVEAELGHVGFGKDYDKTSDWQALMTDPKEAADYVEKTGVDALAVAVGTAHGAYKGEPKIDFDRLEEIRKVTDFPLVIHGGSGSGDENLARLARSGVVKINIANALIWSATERFEAFMKKMMEERKTTAGPWDMKQDQFLEGFKDAVKRHIELFGSANRC